VGAEISAQIMENCLADLLAPVQRITGYDVVMPYFQLEKHYLPSVARIKERVIRLLES
jgi:pyruvate dehydrogenase E1 component beta subunit